MGFPPLFLTKNIQKLEYLYEACAAALIRNNRRQIIVNVKILGTGCPTCRSMYNDVLRIIARNGWNVDVEYVQDIPRIMSYGILATPALVIDEKVVMVGNHGSSRIEQALRRSKRCLSFTVTINKRRITNYGY